MRVGEWFFGEDSEVLQSSRLCVTWFTSDIVRVWILKNDTVDGNQKSGINSPVEEPIVEHPIIYRGSIHPKRW